MPQSIKMIESDVTAMRLDYSKQYILLVHMQDMMLNVFL